MRDPGAVRPVAGLTLLVLADRSQGSLGHLGLASVGDEGAHAADRVRAPPAHGRCVTSELLVGSRMKGNARHRRLPRARSGRTLVGATVEPARSG